MSWWIGTEIDTGDDEVTELSDRSVTYNVDEMFRLALAIPEPGIHRERRYCHCQSGDGIHNTGLEALDRAPCSEAAGVISAALERMRADPAPYWEMSPANRYGSYESAMADLEWLLDQCRRHPMARIYIH